MQKISKRVVDAAKPNQSSRYTIWDPEIKGFGLLVLPSGVKSYIFNYRTPEGRGRRATIGQHGDWTAELARKKAEDWREAVRKGRDPLGEKEELRNAATVGEILDAYLASERFKGKAESTQSIDRGRITRHLRPQLGKKYVHALTTGDVERAFAAIRDGKTAARIKTKARGLARVRGGEGTARMAIRLLRAIFTWAVRERLMTSNPAEHVETGTDGVREIILDDATSYERLFRTLDTMEHERRIRAPVADAIRLIALTGARRGEIAWLRWGHVDLRGGMIVLPPKAHKAGRRTGKPRIIGLPAAAQAIISRQPEGEPDDLVFQPTKGQGVIDISHPWRAVRREAGLPNGIGLHGLRHSVASHMAMSGAQAAEIMTALGHSQLSTAQRYIHWAQSAHAALAEKAASVAMAGMAAAKGKEEGKLLNHPNAGRR